MVVRNSKTNSILLLGAGKGLKKNEKGEFINWTAKSRDGFDLKVYVENGCCENHGKYRGKTGITVTGIFYQICPPSLF